MGGTSQQHSHACITDKCWFRVGMSILGTNLRTAPDDKHQVNRGRIDNYIDYYCSLMNENRFDSAWMLRDQRGRTAKTDEHRSQRWGSFTGVKLSQYKLRDSDQLTSHSNADYDVKAPTNPPVHHVSRSGTSCCARVYFPVTEGSSGVTSWFPSPTTGVTTQVKPSAERLLVKSRLAFTERLVSR